MRENVSKRIGEACLTVTMIGVGWLVGERNGQ